MNLIIQSNSQLDGRAAFLENSFSDYISVSRSLKYSVSYCRPISQASIRSRAIHIRYWFNLSLSLKKMLLDIPFVNHIWNLFAEAKGSKMQLRPHKKPLQCIYYHKHFFHCMHFQKCKPICLYKMQHYYVAIF